MKKTPDFLHRGNSLVEVLVTVLLLSIGILGVAAMGLLTLKNNHSAYQRTQATVLAYDIIDRMQANGGQAANYVIALNATPSIQNCARPDANSTLTCSAANMAVHDRSEWLADIAATLPDGDGSISLNGGVVTVQIQWLDRVDGSTTTFTTSSVL